MKILLILLSLSHLFQTKNIYNGYISENIRVGTTDNVYIRFIDSEKPAVLLPTKCVEATFRIVSGNEDDYFEEPVVDTDINIDGINKCYVQIKLKPNREQLNREAKDVYLLNISYGSGNFEVRVEIIDDNDNDPLFDKYEYQFEISDLTYLPAWSIIGVIKSYDADLARNSEINYFLSSFNPLFGCIKNTGEIYLKFDTRYLFNNYEKIKEYLKFEAKSIDNGPKLDFYDYLVDNQTSRTFRQQNLDTTFISIVLSRRSFDDIIVGFSDGIVTSENIDENVFKVVLNQVNGQNFMIFSLDKIENGRYKLNYEIVDVQEWVFDVNITFAVDICLISNQICGKKMVYSQNIRQLFNKLCKFELKMSTVYDLEVGFYRISLNNAKIGEDLVKLRYGLKKEYDKPYYLNLNLCKYAEIRLSGFKFNYILMDSTYVEAKNGLIILKKATNSFKIDVKIKNLDDLVDDFNINIQFDNLNGTKMSLKQIDTVKSSSYLVQLVAVDGILNESSVIYDLKSNSCQIISDKSMFILKNDNIFSIKVTSLLTIAAVRWLV